MSASSSFSRGAFRVRLVMSLGLVFATTWAATADAQRRRDRNDDDMPLTFVGTTPANIDGRQVRMVGIDPEFIRFEFNGKTMTKRNNQFSSVKLSGALWQYKPSDVTFESMVKQIAEEPNFREKYGAEGRTDEVTSLLASGRGAPRPVEPEPEPEPPSAAPIEPPKAASTEPAPPAALPEAAPAADAAPEGGLPFDVPDWVKYLAAAAAVIVVIQFFRN